MSNPEPVTPTAGNSLRGWLNYWLWFAAVPGLLLAYALLGFLLVPHLITRYATQYVHDSMDRQLRLSKVQFNPFTLTLQLHQAKLSEANGELLGRIDYLLVNAELSSLLTGSYTFKKIRLDAPSVAVIIGADGHLNLDFSDPQAPPSTQAGLPDVRIGELQLNRGHVHVEDRTRPKPFRADFTPLHFTLQNFRTEPRYDNAFHFSGRSAADERFDWRGDFTVQPLGSTGKLQLTALQASTVQSYLQDALPLRLLSGALSLQMDYQLALGDGLQLQLKLPSIAASNVQLAPLNGDAMPWITLPALTISNTELSLTDRHIKIGQIKLDGPQVTAWLDAQRKLNLLQLKGPDASAEQAVTSTSVVSQPAATHPWQAQVDDIVVDDAALSFEDRGVQPATRFKISPAHLQVQHFSSAPGSQINVASTLHINDSAELSANGTVDLDTLGTQLKLKLAGFALTNLQSYAAAATDMHISDGQLNVDGDLYYKGSASNKNPKLKFSGNVNVANLSTQDQAEHQDFIKWRTLQLQNLRYSMAPDQLDIEQIIAHDAYGRVIIGRDGRTNIQEVLRIKPAVKRRESSAPTNASTKASSPAMRIRIARVSIDNGAANFTDNTVQPTFSAGMQHLNGSIVGLSTANDSRARIKLDGSVDNYAPVTISGTANFLAADTFSDVSMNFRNLELTTFNPYSGKFAGYSIAKGKLNTELRYQIANRKLDAQHHIVIDQLEFGAATDSKDAVPLPIKLAVALLKDRNGVIDLNLPVSGSLDDPQFKVGPLIWKVFVGLLTKIVTAPFSALGALFGGDSSQLSYVDFIPGSAALSAGEASKLADLAKAMVERPQLKLNVPLTVVTDADASAMNEAAFNKAVTEILPNPAATPAQRLSALTTLYQRKLNTKPDFPTTDKTVDATAATAEKMTYLETTLKPQFAISAADRDALTHARADAVRTALLGNTELSAERVYLIARSNEAESPEGITRMELKLE